MKIVLLWIAALALLPALVYVYRGMRTRLCRARELRERIPFEDALKHVHASQLIDRTLFVLWRAVVTAAPAGGVIWLMSHIAPGGISLTDRTASFLDPLGRAIGLDGVILLAYVIAIPANEIVVPTILMAYAGSGMLTEVASLSELRTLLVDQHGWTLLTALCLMLFSVLHNPCSTTIWTIHKETGSSKWTALGALLPLSIAFAVTFLVAQLGRLV